MSTSPESIVRALAALENPIVTRALCSLCGEIEADKEGEHGCPWQQAHDWVREQDGDPMWLPATGSYAVHDIKTYRYLE